MESCKSLIGMQTYVMCYYNIPTKQTDDVPYGANFDGGKY